MKFDPTGDVPYQLDLLLNGGLEFGEHIEGAYVSATLNGAETRIQHNLGHTPSGFILLRKDGAGDIWATRVTEWDSVSMYLATDATNLGVRLFVM